MNTVGDPRPRNPWDDAARGWHDQAPLIRIWLADATAAMLDAACIRPGQRVLDLAAGAGDQSIDIARRVGERGSVVATDLSERILELAARRFAGIGVHNVRTRLADMQDLGFAGENFEAAVSRLGLMFCASPLRALRQVHAALAPGARMAALVFAEAQVNPCVSIALRTAAEHAGTSPPDVPSPGSIFSLGCPQRLSDLFAEAGFADIDVQRRSAPMRLASAVEYVAFIRQAAPPVVEVLRTLEDARRRRAWDAIATALDRFTTTDGWVGPNELLLCRGTRPG